MTETIDYNKLSALKIHGMLIDSIVKLAEASRKEGRAFEEPVKHNLGEAIKNSDKVFHEALQLARALFDKTDNIKTVVQNNPA